jgi:Domain of unknown function (DUF5916)/Carbohydrate family 9 binding domain-like
MSRVAMLSDMRCITAVLVVLWSASAFATPSRIAMAKLEGTVTIDGDLTDSGWSRAQKIDGFVEYFRADNAAPPAKTTGWLAYDAQYVYVAFHAEDPRPAAIRAPYVDRDKVLGDQDYVAILLDPQNDRRSAVAFRVNPRGIQADSVVNDADGVEDFSPDFFYDAVARRTEEGWSAEMRIPMSSLRYKDGDPQSWGVILMRNYPRDFRYVMANTPIPKNSGCFVCHAAEMTGLSGLPAGSHLNLAPYTTIATTNNHQQTTTNTDLGFDLKWNPNAKLTIDGTLNPDFSQIESDRPQLAVNTRFALDQPEKRSFFLEGVDLLSTPMRAVYTRTIHAPAWGLRTTGQAGSTAYTMLLAEDRAGGAVVVPGAYGSELRPLEQNSHVFIGRVRHAIGGSFIGALATAREMDDGGHNRVFGPDFLWKLNSRDRLLGQLLVTDTGGVRGHGWRLYFTRDANRYDLFASYRQRDNEFRADNGFIPQVGVSGIYAEAAARFYPKKALSYVRTYFGVEYDREFESGRLMRATLHPGVFFQGRWGSDGWMTLRVADRERVNGKVLSYQFVDFSLRAVPHQRLPALGLEGSIGEKVDYAQGRLGNGGRLAISGTTRPTDHLELQASTTREWLDLDHGRLFSATVDWLKLTYTFTARSLVRVIAQQTEVTRDGSLYAGAVQARDRSRSLSALYGYKLNWQTVFFVGYGDASLTPPDASRLVRESRSLFMKVSYAFQR